MVRGICIIFLWGTVTYILSAPDPIDTVNINLNLGEGTNTASGYVGKMEVFNTNENSNEGSDNGYGTSRYKWKRKSRLNILKNKNKNKNKYRYRYRYGSKKFKLNALKNQMKNKYRYGSKGKSCNTYNSTGSGDNAENMEISDGKIYAGFFKQPYGTSGRIEFNICKKRCTKEQYDCSHPGGEVFLYGRSKERKRPPSTLPTKIDVTENVKKAGISKVDDVRFEVTSIEDLAGVKIEKEVFQPILVFRPRIRTHDLYTIFFNTSVIQPPVIEITKKVKFKIISPNKKIFQVNTQDDYEKCNKKKFLCMASNFYIGKDLILDSENHHNGSFYLFDKDGLPKGCVGLAASNGSKVKILITELIGSI